jgi:nucleoprotein TPR
MANLQSSFDSLTQTHASTQSSLKALQSAHTAQTHQLTQALAKVQGLTGQLAEQEAKYSTEASGLRRLVGMMEEREKQAKEIVEGIEREWASVGERAEQREAALRADVDRESKRRDQAEARVEQLENLMQRMGRGELPMAGTPRRTPGPSDFMADGMMGLSPTVAMASKAQRTGKTFTEVYAEYVRLQEDYAKKTAEYDHMDRTLSAVLAQIEERVRYWLFFVRVVKFTRASQAPILSQQRAEYERLQSEASQLASQLSQALVQRDAQANAAQENAQKLSKSTSENDLLQKQLGDLGRQVQSLLREITRRDDPTIPPEDELESVAAVPAEDISSLITHNLVAFKSITGIQEQNQKLLRIVRELGAKMESEEKDYREAMEREQGEAVREAHEAMQELAAQLERQKKSSESVIQAYMKERDTLRGMVARAEKVGGSAEHVGANGIGHGPTIQSDIAKELAEVQGQFEAYRMEMGVDAGRLREDFVVAQREASQLGAALAKANAKIEYLSGKSNHSSGFS